MSIFGITVRRVEASSYYSDPPRGNPRQRSDRPWGEDDQADERSRDSGGNQPYAEEQSYPQDNTYNPSRPPPPPPPPARGAASSATGYTAPPIHYKFQSRDLTPPSASLDTNPRKSRKASIEDDIPVTFLDDKNVNRPLTDDTDGPQYASARRDAITLFMDRSLWNRWMVRLAAGVVGSTFLTFIGTSLTTKSWWQIYAWTGFWLFLVTAWFRTPYGELCRTAGYLLIMTMRESRQVRRDYPTRPHLRALLGAGPRRPFPPTENPWNYRPTSRDEAPFTMMYTVLAMTIVGSFCGGNLPMVPSWLGALGGAGFLGLLTTRPNARGDLSRAMGMRVVAAVQTLWALQREVGMTPKFWKVASLLLDKLLILDRQHRLKDRLVAFLTFVYDQVMRLVQQVQQQQQQQGGYGDQRGDPRSGRRPPPQDRRGLPPPRGEGDRRGGRRPEQEDYRPWDGFGGEREEDDHGDALDDIEPPPEEPKRRRGLFGF